MDALVDRYVQHPDISLEVARAMARTDLSYRNAVETKTNRYVIEPNRRLPALPGSVFMPSGDLAPRWQEYAYRIHEYAPLSTALDGPDPREVVAEGLYQDAVQSQQVVQDVLPAQAPERSLPVATGSYSPGRVAVHGAQVHKS